MFNREMKNNYTSNGIPMKKFPAVVGLNEWRGVKTIYTEYFLPVYCILYTLYI